MNKNWDDVASARVCCPVVLPTYISNVTSTYPESELDENAQVVVIRHETSTHSVNNFMMPTVKSNPYLLKTPLELSQKKERKSSELPLVQERLSLSWMNFRN